MTTMPTACRARLVVSLSVMLTLSGCAARSSRTSGPDEDAMRRDAIARARVWTPTRVEALDIRRGPGGRRAFRPEATVDCTFVPTDLGGNTPKFICELPGGERVKVKYGRDNGEVFAEVAATRLLWALGFGADDVSPVKVRCKGCPPPA
ncbi:MAG TPA: hypothetical protein VMF13_09600, partial [Luteitalea sp.]|nr:hypothetical protein [Luteitalea sp.]